jgi:hypothetical protein
MPLRPRCGELVFAAIENEPGIFGMDWEVDLSLHNGGGLC